jgi:hypothetical protein
MLKTKLRLNWRSYALVIAPTRSGFKRLAIYMRLYVLFFSLLVLQR